MKELLNLILLFLPFSRERLPASFFPSWLELLRALGFFLNPPRKEPYFLRDGLLEMVPRRRKHLPDSPSFVDFSRVLYLNN